MLAGAASAGFGVEFVGGVVAGVGVVLGLGVGVAIAAGVTVGAGVSGVNPSSGRVGGSSSPASITGGCGSVRPAP